MLQVFWTEMTTIGCQLRLNLCSSLPLPTGVCLFCRINVIKCTNYSSTILVDNYFTPWGILLLYLTLSPQRLSNYAFPAEQGSPKWGKKEWGILSSRKFCLPIYSYLYLYSLLSLRKYWRFLIAVVGTGLAGWYLKCCISPVCNIFGTLVLVFHISEIQKQMPVPFHS